MENGERKREVELQIWKQAKVKDIWCSVILFHPCNEEKKRKRVVIKGTDEKLKISGVFKPLCSVCVIGIGVYIMEKQYDRNSLRRKVR